MYGILIGNWKPYRTKGDIVIAGVRLNRGLTVNIIVVPHYYGVVSARQSKHGKQRMLLERIIFPTQRIAHPRPRMTIYNHDVKNELGLLDSNSVRVL